MRRETVVLGLLGTTLDASPRARWERWRPTVDLCRREDFLVDRLELLHQPQFAELAETVARDIHSVSPETRVRTHALAFPDPWEFESVFATLLDFAHAYPFKPETEDYLVHITTGTHIAQITLFLLNESGFLPGRLIQTSPPRGGKRTTAAGPGHYSIIDLDLSKYDALSTRFTKDSEDASGFLKSGIPTRSETFNRLIGRIAAEPEQVIADRLAAWMAGLMATAYMAAMGMICSRAAPVLTRSTVKIKMTAF